MPNKRVFTPPTFAPVPEPTQISGDLLRYEVKYALVAGYRPLELDLYLPAWTRTNPSGVVIWIHGGGWQGGEKTSVQLKPKFFTDLGYVFVSTNHRYVKAVPMNEIFADIARHVVDRCVGNPSIEQLQQLFLGAG